MSLWQVVFPLSHSVIFLFLSKQKEGYQCFDVSKGGRKLLMDDQPVSNREYPR